jgi:2-(1,2-epoxy-1,2-dihydrophenyl)acetyl-CoA isomerase
MQAFSRIALVPDCGGTWWLPRLIGLQRAMGMALLAERVSAEDAERWGLIWKCIDDAKLMDEANALARTLAAGPTHTYGMIKKALYASSGNTLDQQLDLERDFQRDVGRHGDYREGVAAFLEKRKPEFKGN